MDNQGSWGNPDVDRAVAVKGQPVSVTARNPQVKKVVGGVESDQMGPNPTPTYRYLFADGTYVDVQLSYDTDGSTVLRNTVGGTALKDVAKTQAPDAKAPETKTFPDGSERQWDPAKKDWVIIATKPQGPQQEPAKPIEVGGQLVERQPDGSYKPVYAPPAKPAAGTAPALNLPAQRPGQLTDLSLVESQANQFIAGVNADTTLTPQQRQAKISTYLETVVKPAAEQATKEANDYAAQQQQRQQQADARAQASQDRQDRTESRLATAQDRTAQVAEDRLALDADTARYKRGQDAVSNALELLKYQVDPSFGPDLAGVYNRIIPGAFQPGSFTTQAPDLDAIAAAHVGPILDLHNAPVTQPGQQTAASAAPPAVPPGYGPRTTPPMPPAQGTLPYQQPGGTGVVGRFGQ